MFAARFLTLDLYKSRMERSSAPMIFSADLSICLVLSCFVAELNKTVMDKHRTDWMMAV